MRSRSNGPEPARLVAVRRRFERFGSPECIIELEHPRGAKMRIRFIGQQSTGMVTAVSPVFLGVGS